ncbi:E3 ubiquitin-protein ligase synoviolin-like [Harpia harpyja]|uniref:E3 ubiquitin-protein ligase synoviolin-like n=1 Tax=Harpia harpyja TaxID=202280 RepID=UPI0022B0A136|nr:E3 ubiquitin-protein ligase synoviolin-like [Harpia harpyja]
MVLTLGGSNKDPGTPNICNSWSPAGTGGAWPDPPSASPPPPLGSLTAPRPVQRERKRSPEGNGAGRPVSVRSVARLTSPASESAPGLGAPPDAPPAPGTPLIAYFHTFCMARLNIFGWF